MTAFHAQVTLSLSKRGLSKRGLSKRGLSKRGLSKRGSPNREPLEAYKALSFLFHHYITFVI
jgi:hypothetical protein